MIGTLNVRLLVFLGEKNFFFFHIKIFVYKLDDTPNKDDAFITSMKEIAYNHMKTKGSSICMEGMYLMCSHSNMFFTKKF